MAKYTIGPAVHVQALHLRLENSLRQIGAHASYGIAHVGRGAIHRAYRI